MTLSKSIESLRLYFLYRCWFLVYQILIIWEWLNRKIMFQQPLCLPKSCRTLYRSFTFNSFLIRLFRKMLIFRKNCANFTTGFKKLLILTRYYKIENWNPLAPIKIWFQIKRRSEACLSSKKKIIDENSWDFLVEREHNVIFLKKRG